MLKNESGDYRRQNAAESPQGVGNTEQRPCQVGCNVLVGAEVPAVHRPIEHSSSTQHRHGHCWCAAQWRTHHQATHGAVYRYMLEKRDKSCCCNCCCCWSRGERCMVGCIECTEDELLKDKDRKMGYGQQRERRGMKDRGTKYERQKDGGWRTEGRRNICSGEINPYNIYTHTHSHTHTYSRRQPSDGEYRDGTTTAEQIHQSCPQKTPHPH